MDRRGVRAAVLLAAVGGCLAGACAAIAAAPSAVAWKHYLVESPSTHKIERFWVGHAASLKPDGKYPVIYFLPGLLDDESHWKKTLEPHLGRYNLIAVCPGVGGTTWFMNSPAHPWMRWGDFLTEDLRGFVESHYPASREKGQRGIVGISAGGHAAFYHAVQRPDLFATVSVLSGAMELRGYAGTIGLDYWIGPRNAEAMPLYADRSCIVLASRLDGGLPFALLLDAGDKDGALPQMEALRKVLDSKGARYAWHVGQGAHNWVYWTGRADAHLAWQTERFAENRRENRYAHAAPARGAELKVLAGLPDIAMSEEALRRLQAPWGAPEGLTTTAMAGLPPAGAPLSQADAKFKEAKLTAPLTAQGHKPGLWVYRLMLTTVAPLAKEGTISLAVTIKNGRPSPLFTLPSASLPVPAGQPQRRVELRARLLVEFKPPDPLRGGIIAALQVFDVAGRPLGGPLVGRAGPGTPGVERWPIAPQAQADCALSLTGATALPLAAVHDARVAVEPPAP